MPQLIIRRIRLAHCKMGPKWCEKCREKKTKKICLLDIAPEDAGLAQRRMIEVQIRGEMVWKEFDIIRTFVDEEEARRYAKTYQIDDIKI